MQSKKYLLSSLELLFKCKDQLGYWDSENSRIISKLVHDSDWNWRVYDDESDRYGIFCLSMLLIANMKYDMDLSNYRNKIRKYLLYISQNINNFEKSEMYYGGFNSLVLGHIIGIKESRKEIDFCLRKIKNNIPQIKDNEHSLILIGISSYLQEINPTDKDTRLYLEKILENLLACQNNKGQFETGDIRYPYHQRTMYCLWGLIFSSSIVKNKPIRKAVEKSINYIWENMRDKNDDAFHWHPVFYTVKYGVRFPLISLKSSYYLYECHQSFFANSILFYKSFFASDIFDQYSKRSMDWIFGKNRTRTDLLGITGLNIPARMMKTNGEMFVKNQNFKGSYELGSFILQLSASKNKTKD